MKKNWLLPAALLFALPNLVACGAACGDGVEDFALAEECDDAGDPSGVCADDCTFAAAVTNYRISELVLLGDANGDNDRFGQSNGLIATAVNNGDPTKALNVVINFESTADGATNVTFGPGSFAGEVDGQDSFDFVTDLNGTDVTPVPIPTNITGGVSTFSGADLVLPIEIEFGSGIFAALPIQNVSVSATFGHKQNATTFVYTDLLISQLEEGGQSVDASTIIAEVDPLDLCALNIVLVPGGAAVNLLDAFDDGSPTGAGQQPSSITPPLGTAPDATNCQPCAGPGANADPNTPCILPDLDPDGIPGNGDERYTVSARFEAEGNVVVNPL